MSPEHRQVFLLPRGGQVPFVDGRSDIFQLGVILYELITGQLPFPYAPPKRNSTADLAEAIRRLPATPRPISEIDQKVDGRLAAIVHRCLANDPAERPQTAAELSGLLRGYLSLPNRGKRWLRRHWRLATAAALATAALGVSSVLWWVNLPPYAVAELRRGWDAYHQGDYHAATAYFSRASKADPRMHEAYYAEGRALLCGGNFPEALTLLDEAYRHEASVRYLLARAYCCGLMGRADIAEALFCDVVRRGFKSAIVYNDLAFLCIRQKKLDAAEEWLRQALQVDSTLAAALHNRVLLTCVQALGKGGALPPTWRSDVECLLAVGTPTPELFVSAARLYAIASKSEPACVLKVQDCLDSAVSLGANVAMLRNDPAFAEFRLPTDGNVPQSTAAQVGFRHSTIFLDPCFD
jgi:tetratricopeptide (TPR) repeat protein